MFDHVYLAKDKMPVAKPFYRRLQLCNFKVLYLMSLCPEIGT